MPRRTDLNHVLVIGSGPIVIGQACEFDYSGTQACRVLREEGLRVSLVNSNPATIMTDPEFADATYVEPITAEFIEKIFAREAEQGHPIQAVLATLGGQTALNAAVALHDQGILTKYGVELIGADFDAIQRGEDRQKFKDIVAKVGGESAKSAVCYTMDEVRETVAEPRFPGRRPAVVHDGWARFGIGLQQRGSDSDRGRRPGGVPDGQRVDRGVHPRLEGIRARASCVTAATTWSSSVPSRTWIPSACTPVTRSPSRRR